MVSKKTKCRTPEHGLCEYMVHVVWHLCVSVSMLYFGKLEDMHDVASWQCIIIEDILKIERSV